MRTFIEDKWLKDLQAESEDFASEALFHEVRLREAFAATEGMGVPNIQRTAICLNQLWHLGSKFGRFAAMHRLLVREAMRSVYLRLDESAAEEKEFSTSSLLRLSPFYELIDGLRAEVRRLRYSRSKLSKFAMRLASSGKEHKVFNMAIKAWQDTCDAACSKTGAAQLPLAVGSAKCSTGAENRFISVVGRNG